MQLMQQFNSMHITLNGILPAVAADIQIPANCTFSDIL
jgi:hypothetical protein